MKSSLSFISWKNYNIFLSHISNQVNSLDSTVSLHFEDHHSVHAYYVFIREALDERPGIDLSFNTYWLKYISNRSKTDPVVDKTSLYEALRILEALPWPYVKLKESLWNYEEKIFQGRLIYSLIKIQSNTPLFICCSFQEGIKSSKLPQNR